MVLQCNGVRMMVLLLLVGLLLKVLCFVPSRSAVVVTVRTAVRMRLALRGSQGASWLLLLLLGVEMWIGQSQRIVRPLRGHGARVDRSGVHTGRSSAKR